MAEEKKQKFLVYGKTGWIAGKLGVILTEQGSDWQFSNCRMENRESVAAELDEVKPTHVLCAAGVTGRPNVDWCEDNKHTTIRANVIGALTLMDLCMLRDIHLTNFSTGCIFEYDAEHPIGGKVFTEDDNGNFDGSFYSKSKGLVEQLIRYYPNVLQLRVRMPISDDLHPRNFITKITKYERVVNIPNSMTILTDLLPASISMAKRSLTGIYNFTNPGAISHNEILDLFAKYVRPGFTYKNFTEEEQDKILKARRSNNELDASKLVAACPEIKPIKEAIIGVMERMAVIENSK